MAESTSTLCVMTNYRIIYRSVTSNARGVRRQWEASVPIYAVRSVFWCARRRRTRPLHLPCVRSESRVHAQMN